MNDYFKPLRRKLGVLTLLMACVLMAGWVRSLEHKDSVLYVTSKTSFDELVSFDGRIILETTYYDDSNEISEIGSFEWESRYLPKGCPTSTGKLSGEILWQWRRLGFDFGEAEHPTHVFRHVIRIIPYWSIVIPLTLLSAWLLLSKPRPATQKKTTEFTTEEIG